MKTSVPVAQILDPAHSDSHLHRKQIDENVATSAAAGMAHSQNTQRKKNLQAEQKHIRAVSGGASGKDNLEFFAATQYVHIKSEQHLHAHYDLFSGKTCKTSGKPLYNNADLPAGVFNRVLTGCQVSGMGGTHPLGPEYVWCQRRQQAFEAGAVGMDGVDLDIDPVMLTATNYWQDDGSFTVTDVDIELDSFYLCIDPSITNIFDCVLPRSIIGAIAAGPNLLKLFKDEKVGQEEELTSAHLSDRFTAMMTKRDAAHVRMENQMAESILAYDSLDISDVERRGLRYYGEMEGRDCFVVETRQVLKDIQAETRQVISELIEPWLQKREAEQRRMQEEVMRDYGDDLDVDSVEMEDVCKFMKSTESMHCSYVKDLIHLHLSRIQRSFESKSDRASIPQGYLAM